MDAATQKGKILQYCAEHGSITIREAFEKLYINSPSKRISELRRSGDYNVKAVEESHTNDDGDTKTYKRYYISRVEV
jgi:hypothetical protein